MVIKGNRKYCWRAIARVGDIQSLREIKVSDVSVVSQKQLRYKVVRGGGEGDGVNRFSGVQDRTPL